MVIATDRTQLLPRCCWTSQTSGVLALALDLDGVVDAGSWPGRELDVDDGSGDLDDPAGPAGAAVAMVGCLLRPERQRAFAPDAISIISRVMLV